MIRFSDLRYYALSIRLIFSRSTLPIEFLLATALFLRGAQVSLVFGVWLIFQYHLPLSAPPGTMELMLTPVNVFLGLAHLHALIVTRDRRIRAISCFFSAVVWIGISIQLYVQFDRLVTTFPLLAIFGGWAYIRNRIPPEDCEE